MMKKCSFCSTQKEIEQFGKRAASKDGLNAACKECMKKRDEARYRKESLYRAEKRKEYMQTEQGKSAHLAAAKKWRDKNEAKRAAHILVGNRVKAGKIKKQPCQMCGTELGIHAHHDDYSMPLDVMWLCVVHHKARHAFLDHAEQKNRVAA